jgi:hypothetical protein
VSRAAALALLLALPALAPAQSRETERALLERQQQSDRFSLQLRQSQSLIGMPASERGGLDARYLEQRQAQDQLHDAQLRDVVQQPEAMRAGASDRYERDRRSQDAGAETPPQRGRADADAGVRWSPTLEDRFPDGVSWTPTLERRRP